MPSWYRHGATVGLVLGGVACGGEPGPVTVAYAFPAGGRTVVEVARDQVAAHAGPGDLRVFFVYDSIGTTDPPDLEIERAQSFVLIPGLAGVVGHGGSRGTLAALPIYEEAGIPTVVPTSTSRLLADQGPWTFLLADNDSVEGAFLAEFVTRRFGPSRVTIFYVNDEYGVGLRDGVLAGLAATDVVIVDQVPVTENSDGSLLVDASLRRGRPDVVILATRWRAAALVARAYHNRGHRVPLVAGDGVLPAERMVALAGTAADSVYAVTFWTAQDTSATSRAYVERFRRVTGGRVPSGPDAMSHDALMLMVQAIREVGRDRTAIRDWLSSLGVTRPPYAGVTGALTFRPDRPPRFAMIRLRNGVSEPVDVP